MRLRAVATDAFLVEERLDLFRIADVAGLSGARSENYSGEQDKGKTFHGQPPLTGGGEDDPGVIWNTKPGFGYAESRTVSFSHREHRMEKDVTPKQWECINCGKNELEAAVIQFHYAGTTGGICTSCLPILIHHPERLAEKLPRPSGT
jgi:hypothetical protein